jgi:hypothetical protein
MSIVAWLPILTDMKITHIAAFAMAQTLPVGDTPLKPRACISMRMRRSSCNRMIWSSIRCRIARRST